MATAASQTVLRHWNYCDTLKRKGTEMVQANPGRTHEESTVKPGLRPRRLVERTAIDGIRPRRGGTGHLTNTIVRHWTKEPAMSR